MAGLLAAATVFLVARSLLNNYLFDTGVEQTNAMNLPAWASTPVSWLVGGVLVLSLPVLFRFFITGTVSATDRWWLAALIAGALLVNFVSFHNTPRREACDEINACFGPNGQALRWFSKEPEGRIVLWGAGGRHPTRNTPLLPVTAQVIEQWQRQDNSQPSSPPANALLAPSGAKRARP